MEEAEEEEEEKEEARFQNSGSDGQNVKGNWVE